MFTGALPPIVAQILLVIILVAVVLFFLRIVLRARRQRIAEAVKSLSDADAALLAADLPQLTTPYRVSAPIVRLILTQAVPAPPLAELRYGKKPLSFTPTDFVRSTARERYQTATAKDAGNADVALFALCTLEAGGADAIQEQIKDYDKVQGVESAVRFVPAQTQAGDYVVIARVLSHRNDEVSEGVPVIVYRAEVIKNAESHLVIELAVPNEGQTPFLDGSMVHGTARLYGYLP